MKYEVTAPDGKQYIVEGPEGASEADIVREVKFELNRKEHRMAVTAQADRDFDEAMTDPTGSFVENLAAGAGKMIHDVGQGFRDIAADFSGDPERRAAMDAEIAQTRQQDAPLMNTAGGMTGYIGAGMVPAVATAAVPGANTAVGAGLYGAAYGAVQPTMGDESRAANTALGGTVGAATQGVMNWAGKKLTEKAASLVAAAGNGSAKEQLVKQAVAEGIVLDPTHVRPTVKNNLLRSWGGMTATEEQLAAVNMPTINRLAKVDMGVHPDSDLTPEVLRQIRLQEGKAYAAMGEVGNIFKSTEKFRTGVVKAFEPYLDRVGEKAGDVIPELNDLLMFFTKRPEFSQKNIMGRLSDLRANADTYLGGRSMENVPSSVSLMKGRVMKNLAEEVEKLVGDSLERTGDIEKFKAFQAARTRIAKAHTYEKAASPSGNVDPEKLWQELKKGKPLTGNARLIAELRKEYPRVVKLTKRAPDSYSIVNQAAMLMSFAAGHPIVGGYLGGRPIVRAAISNPKINAKMINSPNYTPGMAQLGAGVLNNPVTQTMPRGFAPMAAGYWNPFDPPQQQ